MNKMSLDALGREHLERARAGTAGRSAETVCGGHEWTLRQTVIALLEGSRLGEHDNLGEATLHVLSGRVRLNAGDTSWEGRSGDLIVVPQRSHDVEALADSVVLLTFAAVRR